MGDDFVEKLHEMGCNDYLVPESSDTAAKGVGVYLEDENNQKINVGDTKQQTVVNGADGKALPNQTIPLAAYIGTTTGVPRISRT